MTETLFYHLEKRSLYAVLPDLIEKTIKRGWRALIKTESAERADAVDNLLWTYNEESFLPQAQSGDGKAERQPVLITVEDGNPNAAQVLFLVGGAPAPSWNADGTFSRIVLVFDGRDENALSRARAAWKSAKEAGHDLTYWREGSGGRFEKQQL